GVRPRGFEVRDRRVHGNQVLVYRRDREVATSQPTGETEEQPAASGRRGSPRGAEAVSVPDMSKNAELARRRDEAVVRGVSNILPNVYAARARGAEIWDVEGKRYIDFDSGIAVLNVGHGHPAVMAAAKAQLEDLVHTCFQVTPYEAYVQLAERLNAIAPCAGPRKTLFLTTGAEAVENAVKIARFATGRTGVVAFSGAFHG